MAPLSSSSKAQTQGTVIRVTKVWWIKVNTKPIRRHATDGALFPHIATVHYRVNGKDYEARKWLGIHTPLPEIGSEATVTYSTENPKRAAVQIP